MNATTWVLLVLIVLVGLFALWETCWCAAVIKLHDGQIKDLYDKNQSLESKRHDMMVVYGGLFMQQEAADKALKEQLDRLADIVAQMQQHMREWEVAYDAYFSRWEGEGK